jgi:hypothetical protein
VLETFSVTTNATSIDGTHYYQEINVGLAQLVTVFNTFDLNDDEGVPSIYHLTSTGQTTCQHLVNP